MPKWENFQLLFFLTLFQPIIFLFLFCDSDNNSIDYFVIISQVSEILFIFLFSY